MNMRVAGGHIQMPSHRKFVRLMELHTNVPSCNVHSLNVSSRQVALSQNVPSRKTSLDPFLLRFECVLREDACLWNNLWINSAREEGRRSAGMNAARARKRLCFLSLGAAAAAADVIAVRKLIAAQGRRGGGRRTERGSLMSGGGGRGERPSEEGGREEAAFHEASRPPAGGRAERAIELESLHSWKCDI